MIEQRHFELTRCARQADRRSDVGVTRRWIAAWVIVHEDEGRSPQAMSSTQDMCEIHFTARDVTLRNCLHGEELQVLVDVKRKKPLARLSAKRFYVALNRAPAAHVPRPEESFRR